MGASRTADDNQEQEAPAARDSEGQVTGLILGSIKDLHPASRALVVICGLVALVAVPLGVLSDQPIVVALAFVVLLIGLLLVYLVQRNADRDRTPPWSEALESVSGDWWQLAVDADGAGLTLLSIRPQAYGGCVISGERWTSSGRRRAHWRTETTAIQRVDPLTIFYHWEGAYIAGLGEVSGVGSYEFVPTSGSGTGWFTTGRIEEGQVDVVSRVYLRRPGASERRALRQRDPDKVAAVVRDRYVAMREEILGMSALPGLSADDPGKRRRDRDDDG